MIIWNFHFQFMLCKFVTGTVFSWPHRMNNRTPSISFLSTLSSASCFHYINIYCLELLNYVTNFGMRMEKVLAFHIRILCIHFGCITVAMTHFAVELFVDLKMCKFAPKRLKSDMREGFYRSPQARHMTLKIFASIFSFL